MYRLIAQRVFLTAMVWLIVAGLVYGQTSDASGFDTSHAHPYPKLLDAEVQSRPLGAFDGSMASPAAFQRPPEQSTAPNTARSVPGSGSGIASGGVGTGENLSGSVLRPETSSIAPSSADERGSFANRPATHQESTSQAANDATGRDPVTSRPAESRDHRAPLPLAQSEKVKPLSPATGEEQRSSTTRGVDALLTVMGSLGVVLGLFLVTIWCVRRGMPKSARPLPGEAVEVLGRAPLVGRQQMHLLRFGNKLVLVSVSQGTVDAISEITDPAEVDRVAGLCAQAGPFSSTAAFRGALSQFERGPAEESPDDRPARATRLSRSYGRSRSSQREDEHA